MEHSLNKAKFSGIITRKYNGEYGGGASFHIKIECPAIKNIEKEYEVCCHATDAQINKVETGQHIIVEGAFYLKKQWVAKNVYIFPEIYNCEILNI